MRSRRDALSGDLYEEIEDGKIRVTGSDGSWGIFRPDGEWLEGERTHAELHLLVWVGGEDLPPAQRLNVRIGALTRMADKLKQKAE